MRIVYHLYIVFAEDRDALLRYCVDKGIEAKVHYPVPLYQQDGTEVPRLQAGQISRSPTGIRARSSPFLATSISAAPRQDYVIQTVRDFYARG